MPAAVAAAVVAELAITGTEAAIVTIAVEIAVTVAISVGLSIVEQAIQGSPEQPKPPHGRRENFRSARAPRVRAYGRVRLGGSYAFLDVGTLGGGFTGVLFQVIVMGQGRFDQFEDFYLNDGKVEFELPAGPHTVIVPKNYVFGGGHYAKIFCGLLIFAERASPTRWFNSYLPVRKTLTTYSLADCQRQLRLSAHR
jgi:hypothetical protein